MRLRRPPLLSDRRLLSLWGSIRGRIAPALSALSRRRLLWNGIALLVVVVLIAGFVWNTAQGVAAVQQDVADVLDTVRGQDLQQLTTAEEYAELLQQIREVESELGSLRTRSAVFRGFRWVPGIGSRIREATLFLDMGDHFARGTRLTLEGYRGVANALNPNTPPEVIAALAADLESAGPLFAEAQTELARAAELRAQLGSPTRLGDTVLRALELIDQFQPLIEVATIVAVDAPQLTSDALELRRTVTELRARLREPAVLLERSEEFQRVFTEVQAQAVSIQAGLLQVRSSIDEENVSVVDVLDTALQASVLLENLGAGMARLAAVTDQVFRQGLFSRDAGELLGEELPATQAMIQVAQKQLAELNDLLAEKREEAGTRTLLTLVTGMLGSPASPLQREESLLRTGANVVNFLDYFLGYEQPRTYLVLGQNDDEIRATGGFIGVAVEMTLDKGELAQLRFLDSTTVDGPLYDINPLAPEPIFRYLWISKLLFRDGNWNPHFPAASAQLADIYERAQGVRVDGVLAVTEEVVLDLVDAFGGVRVPELPDLLDREQAERYIEGELPYVCLPRHISFRSKRCFDEDLFQAVVDRLTTSMSQEERTGVVDTLLARLGRRDALLHVFDPVAAEILWEQGWNGALTQVDHDYLLVVDSAVPGHVRSVVERRLQYEVSLAVDGPQSAELLVEYRYQGGTADPNCRQTFTGRTGCFWNYVRVYIPVLASEIKAPPIPVHQGAEWLVWGYTPADSLSVISSPRGGRAGLTEIGGYLTVEPGTSLTLPLRYTLPQSMVRQIGDGLYQYRLLLQKQPGTPVEPVSVFVQLPEGAKLVRTSRSPTGQVEQWVRLDFPLEGDETVVVDFRLP